jgi:molecular chaperone GrpE
MTSNNQQQYCLSPKQYQKLLDNLGGLLKNKFSLEQKIREQTSQTNAEKEELFLELLEVYDGLESLIAALEENPDNPRLIKRLPKSLTSLQNKLLTTLKRRDVTLIEHSSSFPDYEVCEVVDREERNDLENNTITKIVRKGFFLKEKVLRYLEIITSQNSNS